MYLRYATQVVSRLLISIGIMFCVSSVSNAQLALEEIVVTAQKRSQNLQDVPISVLAISGDEIARQGFKRLEDVTALMPNVSVTEAALGDQLFIRGIGSGLNIGFEQSVGTFIDGVYFGRGLQSRNIFLDIERIEVLRGPQSTFFGNNAIAGAMSVTTRGPTEDWEGYVSGLYEDGTGTKNIDAAAGGPITDTLGIRIAGRYSDQDGWQTNSTIDKKEPREERLAGRVTLEWTPSDSFDASLKYQVESNDVEGRSIQAVGCPPPDGQPPAGYCLGYGILGPALVPGTPIPDFVFDDRRNGGNGVSPFPTNEDFNDLKNRSGNLTLNWQVSDHTITSITGYSKYEDHRSQSAILLAGPFPAPIIPFANIEHVQEDFEQFSQEIRITSATGKTIEYLAGVYFQDSELNVTNDFSAATFATRLSQHDQDEKTFAAFGSLTWNVNERLRLAFGLRYTDVTKDVRREQILATNQGNLDLDNAIPMTPANPFFGAFLFGFQWKNGIIEESRSDDDLSPSLNIQYDFSDDTMAYASYAEGFKAGGFDEQNGRLDPESFAFRPETVKAFEIGAKTRLADGAMTLNAAVFRNEFTDLQVQTFDGVINFLVTNAAESVTQGAELDISWQLSDSLILDFHGAYLDATYKDRANGQCTTTQTAGLSPGCNFSDPRNPRQDLTNARLTYAPEISGNIGLTHLYTFSNDYSLRTNAVLLYSDDFNTADDNDPFLVQGSFTKFDATITLSNPDNTWEVSLIGRNLFDEQTSSAGNDLPLSAGSYFQFLDRPRTVAIQARYNWK